jgi:drug/metabolite transporter (DMT)-like permease
MSGFESLGGQPADAVRRQRLALALMIASGIAFGFSVSAAKVALRHVGPLEVLFWTRVVAGLTLIPGIPRPALWPRFRQALLPGVLLGVLLFVVFAIQLAGLRRTSAANASLILGIHVVATPFLARALIHETPHRLTVLSAGMCAVGIAFVSGRPNRASLGDALVLGAALLLPLHTIVIARWTRVVGARDLVRIQTVVAGVLAAVALLGRVGVEGAVKAAPALLVGGVLGGSLAVTAQATAQRTLGAAETALFLAIEPLLGALIAVAWLGEHLAPTAWIGGLVIVAAIIVGTKPSVFPKELPST